MNALAESQEAKLCTDHLNWFTKIEIVKKTVPISAYGRDCFINLTQGVFWRPE